MCYKNFRKNNKNPFQSSYTEKNFQILSVPISKEAFFQGMPKYFLLVVPCLCSALHLKGSV